MVMKLAIWLPNSLKKAGIVLTQWGNPRFDLQKIIWMSVCRDLEKLESISSDRKKMCWEPEELGGQTLPNVFVCVLQKSKRSSRNVGKILISKVEGLKISKRTIVGQNPVDFIFLEFSDPRGVPLIGPLFGRLCFFSQTPTWSLLLYPWFEKERAASAREAPHDPAPQPSICTTTAKWEPSQTTEPMETTHKVAGQVLESQVHGAWWMAMRLPKYIKVCLMRSEMMALYLFNNIKPSFQRNRGDATVPVLGSTWVRQPVTKLYACTFAANNHKLTHRIWGRK